MSVLDSLLEGAAEREELTLSEDAGSRARWEKWEKEHGKGAQSIVKGVLNTGGRIDLPDGTAIRHTSDRHAGLRSHVTRPGEGTRTFKNEEHDAAMAHALRGHPGSDPTGNIPQGESQASLRAKGRGLALAAKGRGHAPGDKVSVFHPGNSSTPPHTFHGTVEKVTPSHVHVRDASGYKSQTARKVPRSAFHSRFGAKLSSSHRPLKEDAGPPIFVAPLQELAPSKPGTNWTQVTPENRKKVDPLVRHWMGHAHPWQACVDELAPEKGLESAKRICSVVKDMGMKTTKWRKGGKKKLSEAEERELLQTLAGSLERMVAVEEALGEGAVEAAAQMTPEGEAGRTLMEMCFSDLCVVASLRPLVEGEELAEAPGDFDAGALLAKVKAAPRWRDPPVPGRMTPLPWTVLGPPDSPSGVIEDDRTAHQKRRAVTRANYSAAKAAGAYKGTSSATPGSAQPSGLTGTATTSRDRWAKWDSINRGKSGAPVQGVQARLGIKTDGSFGPKTQNAVRRFQTRNGLQVDGVVGRQTFAALAGKQGASKIKVGKLSTGQVKALSHFSRGGGTILHKRRRLLASAEEAEPGSLQEEMLVEAERATLGDFPDRVRSLSQGEVARMPDGVAVRRAATLDGRDVFQVGEPTSYGDRPGEVRWWEGAHHRKAEDAIHRAHEASAARTDPASVGGETRFQRHSLLTHNGREVRYLGLDGSGQALVRDANNLSAASRLVPLAQLGPRPRLIEEEAPLQELKKLPEDPRGTHKVGHVVRFQRGMRANRTQDDVSTRPGVITGFHKRSQDPIIKDLGHGVERIIPRKDIVSTHGPLSAHSGVSNWAKWNAEHPNRSHGRRTVESASEVADADVPFHS